MRQRDFPKYLIIRTSIWEVRFVRRVPGSDDGLTENVGLCHGDDHVILIKQGLGREERLVTFVHEVLHAIEYEYGVQVGHGIINAIEAPIATLLLENWL